MYFAKKPKIKSLSYVWNNAVGFEHILTESEEETEDTLESEEIARKTEYRSLKFLRKRLQNLDAVQIFDWNKDILQIHLSEKIDRLFFVLKCEFTDKDNNTEKRYVSIGRHLIFDEAVGAPVLFSEDHWKHYHVKDGFIVMLQPLVMRVFAEKLKSLHVRASQLRNLQIQGEIYLVTHKSHSVTLHAFHQAEIHIEWPGNTGCFSLLLELNRRYAWLTSLFYDVDKNLQCYGAAHIPNVGSWLLSMMDKLLGFLRIESVVLEDVSSFNVEGKSYHTHCVYSATHNGMSFYMSKGFLLCTEREFERLFTIGKRVPRKLLQRALARTNKSIAETAAFWNARGSRSDFEKACEDLKLPEQIYMFKPYNPMVLIHKPENPEDPAILTLGAAAQPTHAEQKLLSKLNTIRHKSE